MSSDPPWSQLGLAEDQAIYTSPTQNALAVSEHWAAASLFCPACGTAPLDKARANTRVRDFSCAAGREEYELKATKGRIDFILPLTPAKARAQIVWHRSSERALG